MKHGEAVKNGINVPVSIDPITRKATMKQVPAVWCGHCGFPVEGDQASLDRHVEKVHS